MVNAVEKARARAKQCLEASYEGFCTVIECQHIKDAVTKVKQPKEVVVLEDKPCRLSFEKTSVTAQTDTASVVQQGVKLFLSPELMVKPGSKIIVNQNGICTEYAASGMPAVYVTHQEIMLEMFKGWA